MSDFSKKVIKCSFCGKDTPDEPYRLIICKHCNGVMIKREK